MAWIDDADALNRATRDTFGQACAYTLKGGAPAAIRAILDKPAATATLDGHVTAELDGVEYVLDVRLADLAGAPRVGDKVTTGGKSFEVVGVRPGGNGSCKLPLVEVAA